MRQLVCVAAAALFAGCAYQSHYTAPLDGRARPVWTGNGVTVELAGAAMSDACAAQLGAFAREGRIHLMTGELKPVTISDGERVHVAPVVWVPVYFGAPLVAIGGLPPPLLHPPLFAPTLAAGALVNAANVRAPSAPSANSDLAKMGAIVAVIAILVLPIIDLTLATVPAENTTRSAEAIDQANLYNDLARTPGSPCAYGVQ
jgi:hypothetical protein